MSSYRDALLRIADGSARQVLAAYRSYVDGLLTHDEAVAYISSAIAAANGRARMLADLRLAAEVMAALGTEQPVAGVPMPSDRERLAKAAATMLATAAKSEVPEKIARRLAESEPVQAASEATTEAMVRSGKTNGWVRDLSPDACQMPVVVARRPRVADDHRMPQHPGCTCHQRPVFAENIRETGNRQAERTHPMSNDQDTPTEDEMTAEAVESPTPPQADTAPEAEEVDEQADTFPRSVVESLRQENGSQSTVSAPSAPTSWPTGCTALSSRPTAAARRERP